MLKQTALFIMLATCWVTTAQAATTIKWEPYTLTGPEQQVAQGELGYINVPENRTKSSGKQLRLGFVRLPSTAKTPGNPIVYLAGGPGGSATWTARSARFPLFVKLTAIADVIIFDQRGTGLSRNDLQDCDYTPDIALADALTQKNYLTNMQLAISKCAAEWRSAGVDLNGYNTLESAHDIDALREALGVKQVDLWAISYGTHLAFATAKTYPSSIGKMVLASAEGPDDTIKSPALADAQLKRIAHEISLDKKAAQQYPDLLGMMARVHKKYRENPVVIDVINPQTGELVKIGVGELDIQLLTAGALTRDPEVIADLPGFYALLDAGDFSFIGPFFLGFKTQLWNFNPMAMAMDAASGISPKRWEKIQQEAKTSLLWRAHNLPFPDINASLAVTDLGDGYREDPKSQIPTLFLSGTLDGRTFTERHKELARGFSNANFVSVVRGGHNLFLSSPEIIKIIEKFLRGEKVSESTVELPPIQFR